LASMFEEEKCMGHILVQVSTDGVCASLLKHHRETEETLPEGLWEDSFRTMAWSFSFTPRRDQLLGLHTYLSKLHDLSLCPDWVTTHFFVEHWAARRTPLLPGTVNLPCAGAPILGRSLYRPCDATPPNYSISVLLVTYSSTFIVFTIRSAFSDSAFFEFSSFVFSWYPSWYHCLHAT